MDEHEIAKVLKRRLEEWQIACGNERPDIKSSCKPLKDLPDFDSLAAVAVIGEVADELGLNIPDQCNPFTSKKLGADLTLTQVARQFLKMHKPTKATPKPNRKKNNDAR